MTPERQKQAQVDTQNLPVDLAEIVILWPDLPDNIKAAVKALVRPYAKDAK